MANLRQRTGQRSLLRAAHVRQAAFTLAVFFAGFTVAFFIFDQSHFRLIQPPGLEAKCTHQTAPDTTPSPPSALLRLQESSPSSLPPHPLSSTSTSSSPPSYLQSLSSSSSSSLSESSKNLRSSIFRSSRLSWPSSWSSHSPFMEEWMATHSWPPKPASADFIERRNRAPPMNMDRFPTLADDHIVFVLYVHNRSEYLRLILTGLERVQGINETLLVVSHDGFYEEMDNIVRNITFCRVKQIYFPFSPHLFENEFPAYSPGDCRGKRGVDLGIAPDCAGQPDAFGSYRNPNIISLKHHWWWLMNTVWDGLNETRGFDGHILFFEEDHYLLPNAYLVAKSLVRAKQKRFTGNALALMLAPFSPKDRGNSLLKSFFLDRWGNIGFSFNRTMWEWFRGFTQEFCEFDDYNWDITLRMAVLWNTPLGRLPTLRWSRASALHIGSCGLHAGKGKGVSCTVPAPAVMPDDLYDPVNPDGKLLLARSELKFGNGFGGWGDVRDRELCRYFSMLYRDDLPSHT